MSLNIYRLQSIRRNSLSENNTNIFLLRHKLRVSMYIDNINLIFGNNTIYVVYFLDICAAQTPKIVLPMQCVLYAPHWTRFAENFLAATREWVVEENVPRPSWPPTKWNCSRWCSKSSTRWTLDSTRWFATDGFNLQPPRPLMVTASEQRSRPLIIQQASAEKPNPRLKIPTRPQIRVGPPILQYNMLIMTE